MDLGFTSMNTPEDVDPATLGRALEERGFTSLWIGEHSHIPVARRTPYPIGGELPPMYRRMMDPFPTLLAAALATDGAQPGDAAGSLPATGTDARAACHRRTVGSCPAD